MLSLLFQLSYISTGSIGRWYSLDGGPLSGKPSRKGIYLYNNQKVVIGINGTKQRNLKIEGNASVYLTASEVVRYCVLVVGDIGYPVVGVDIAVVEKVEAVNS